MSTCSNQCKGPNTFYEEPGSEHAGGCHVGAADGLVHFINDTIDLGVFKELGSIAGGGVSDIP